MTLNEFRHELVSYRRDAEENAKPLKDPYITLERLHLLYERLSDSEKLMANSVFAEWALSENEGLRFDAVAIISDFGISATLPALHELAQRLVYSKTPSAPYELQKVERLINKLADLALTRATSRLNC